jgi:hypothetical protein
MHSKCFYAESSSFSYASCISDALKPHCDSVFCIKQPDGHQHQPGLVRRQVGVGCIFIKPQQPHREYQVECHRAGDNEPARY